MSGAQQAIYMNQRSFRPTLPSVPAMQLSAYAFEGLADGTTVTSWTNIGSAGATYNASTARGPVKTTVSGRPVLYFDGLDIMSLATAVNMSTGSVFYVAWQLNSRMVVLGGETPNGNCFLGWSENSNTGFLFRNTTDAGLTLSGLSSVASLKSFGIVKTSTSSSKTFDNTTSGVSRGGLSGTFTFKGIGYRQAYGTQYSNGYIAEILFYDTALNDTDAASVITSLKNRWGIA